MGTPPPDPRAYDGGRRYSPTSSLRQIGDVPQIPETPPPLLNISGCTYESNHVLALLIFIPCFESINFYQNKLKIKLFLQNNTNFLSSGGYAPKPLKRPFPHCRFLVACLLRDVCCSYFLVLESYNEKFLS